MIVEDELLIFAQICTNVFNEQISVSSYYKETKKKWQKGHFCSIKTLIFVNILVSNTLLIFEISKLRAWKALWIIKTNENCKFNFSHLWMKILKMNQSVRIGLLATCWFRKWSIFVHLFQKDHNWNKMDQLAWSIFIH